jgi:PBP1b-binding outer membrane lipoprotein LpoB
MRIKTGLLLAFFLAGCVEEPRKPEKPCLDYRPEKVKTVKHVSGYTVEYEEWVMVCIRKGVD